MFIPFGFMATQAGGGGDADATAYIDEVIAAGGTLSAGDQTAIDDLFVGLKADSIYTKLKLMYPYMGNIAASTKINAINPTTSIEQLTYVNGFTHTSSGITNSSSSPYGFANIGVAPSDMLSSINDASWGISTTATSNSNGGFMIGNFASSVGTGIRFQAYRDNGPTSDFYAGFGSPVFATTSSTGYGDGFVWIGTRTSSTSLILYKDGVNVNSNTSTNSGTLNTNNFQFFNADNQSDVLLSNKTFSTWEFMFVGEGLDSTQASNMSTRINTFLTAIGR